MSKKNKKAVSDDRTSLSSAGSGDARHMHLWAAAFLFFTTIIAYSASLNGTWALDDNIIGQFQDISSVLNLRLGYRKIAYLTFQVNKLIDPLNPLNYRVLNILIHIVNALLIYRIAFLTLRLPGLRDEYGRYAYAVSLASAAVFALHPININAVTYIVQRMASLVTMFVLISLLCYISARTSDDLKKSAGFYAATGVCVLLGIFSKENGVMAVPLLLLYDFFFLPKNRRKSFVQAGIGIAAISVVMVASFFILDFKKTLISIGNILLGLNRPITFSEWAANDVYWTPLQHILTEFRVLARYVFLLFAPLPRFLVFDWWGYPVSAGILNPLSTLASFLMIVSGISFSVYKRKKLPFLSFGILWYFIAISLESFIAVGSDLYFEHRNYLPVAGLFFGASAQILTAEALRKRVLKGKVLWTGIVILSLSLGLLTFQRNLAWKDSITLWNDTVDKTDRNLRAMIALGNAYLKVSDLAAAKKYYEESVDVSLSRKFAGYLNDSIYSLGMVDLFMGRLEDARKVIEIMDNKLVGSYRLDILKGAYSSLSGDPGGAIKRFEGILPSASGIDRVVVFNLMGDAFFRKGSPEKAIENYKNAIQLDPSFSDAYYGMGTAYLSMKDLKNASYFIERTLALDPHNVLALSDMADILLIKKEPPEKARDFAARAVANSPVFYQPYLTMGNVLIVMGRDGDADGYYMKAREHGMQDFMIPYSKGRAYFMKGDKAKAKIYLKEVLSSADAPEALKKSISGNLATM